MKKLILTLAFLTLVSCKKEPVVNTPATTAPVVESKSHTPPALNSFAIEVRYSVTYDCYETIIMPIKYKGKLMLKQGDLYYIGDDNNPVVLRSFVMRFKDK